MLANGFHLFWIFPAGCVYYSDRESKERGNSFSSIPRKTRGAIYKSESLSHDAVEERAFAGVRSADDGEGEDMVSPGGQGEVVSS